jgi:hypothetical protein
LKSTTACIARLDHACMPFSAFGNISRFCASDRRFQDALGRFSCSGWSALFQPVSAPSARRRMSVSDSAREVQTFFSCMLDDVLPQVPTSWFQVLAILKDLRRLRAAGPPNYVEPNFCMRRKWRSGNLSQARRAAAQP